MGAYHWVQCDRSSPLYNPPLEARYQVLMTRLGPAKLILDVGCGDGYLMSLASSRCETVIGIDPELSGVALAAVKLKPFANCAVGQADAYSLPFKANCFDVILFTDVFEHLNYPDICMKEICRVMRPKGTLFLSTPQWRPDRRWDHLHVKEYKPEELRDCLQRYFCRVDLTFFWPLVWSNRYATRVGFKLVRIFCRYLYNPFLQESAKAENYGQILAVCEQPRGS